MKTPINKIKCMVYN